MTLSSKTLYWHPTGPKIVYERHAFGDYLAVEDLNPEKQIRFRLSPVELLKIGFKCIAAACLP